MEGLERDRSEIASLMERILYEVKRVVVGQDHFLERVLVALRLTNAKLLEARYFRPVSS